MIVGIDRSGRGLVHETFPTPAAGRAWCYSAPRRTLYEVDGRLMNAPLWFGRADMVAHVCEARGRVLTRYVNRPRVVERRAA